MPKKKKTLIFRRPFCDCIRISIFSYYYYETSLMRERENILPKGCKSTKRQPGQTSHAGDADGNTPIRDPILSLSIHFCSLSSTTTITHQKKKKNVNHSVFHIFFSSPPLLLSFHFFKIFFIKNIHYYIYTTW